MTRLLPRPHPHLRPRPKAVGLCSPRSDPAYRPPQRRRTTRPALHGEHLVALASPPLATPYRLQHPFFPLPSTPSPLTLGEHLLHSHRAPRPHGHRVRAHHHTHHTHRTCKGAGDTLHCTRGHTRRTHPRSAFVLLLRRRRADAAAPSSTEHAGHTPSQDGTTSHFDFEQNDLILRRQSLSSGCCARRCSEGCCWGGRRLLPWCAS